MMLLSKSKSERLKIYILIIGCILFVTVGYFRFFHKKPASVAARNPSVFALDQLQVPRVETNMPPKMQLPELLGAETLQTFVRDIFSPLTSTSMGKMPAAGQSSPGPSFAITLMGTIVGGGKPLAVINDQFVGTGDWVGEYQVTLIDKNKVLLDSGKRQIKLEMVKDE
jgi:hypothetical protein